jgi:hypothetical protein
MGHTTLRHGLPFISPLGKRVCLFPQKREVMKNRRILLHCLRLLFKQGLVLPIQGLLLFMQDLLLFGKIVAAFAYFFGG